jgi:predicted ATP-dependent serine protease
MTGPTLVGRERKTRAVDDLVDRAGERGGALVIRGEAGIGKSSLLVAAKSRARHRGFEVLTTAGVQSEAHLPFAGFHQLLRRSTHQDRAVRPDRRTMQSELPEVQHENDEESDEDADHEPEGD